MRVTLIGAGLALGGYLALAWGVRQLAEAALFPAPRPSYSDDGHIVWIELADGARLAARYTPAPAGAPTVLFFHGNAEDLGHNTAFLGRLTKLGVGVLAIDYRGYGLSAGRASVTSLEADGRAALRWLREVAGVRAEEVIAFGRSLGGGPATLLAAEAPLRGLVLESAFSSVYRVVLPVALFPGDSLPNARRLQAVRCPVFVVHGALDRVIRPEHADRLVVAARAAGLPVQEWRLPLAGHNDVALEGRDAYWQKLDEFFTAR